MKNENTSKRRNRLDRVPSRSSLTPVPVAWNSPSAAVPREPVRLAPTEDDVPAVVQQPAVRRGFNTTGSLAEQRQAALEHAVAEANRLYHGTLIDWQAVDTAAYGINNADTTEELRDAVAHYVGAVAGPFAWAAEAFPQ